MSSPLPPRRGASGLVRHVGLARTELKRVALKRGSPLKSVGKRGRRGQAVWRLVCADRLTFCGGVCEWPGCRCRATDGHHWKPRGRGGKNTVENCRQLCRTHHTVCHEQPLRAAAMGMVHSSKIGGEA